MVGASNPKVDYSDLVIFIVMDSTDPEVNYFDMRIFIVMNSSNKRWIIPAW